MTNPHPLQSALDRATVATYTAIDLIDIARERKPRSSGSERRTDARQASLYRAVIASSIAALEESFEALTVAGLVALGTPTLAVNRLSTTIATTMQSPNPNNIDNLLGDYLGFKPSDHWSAHLAYSPVAYRKVKLADVNLDHYNIYNAYPGFREFKQADLSSVLARFVRIRNSFAHQDTSKTIFTKEEQGLLKTLRKRKANNGKESLFVVAASTTCAVTLNSNAKEDEDPIVRWTVHETQAINALRLYLGVIISSCDALANHLESSAGIVIGSFDQMTLRVQKGTWSNVGKKHDFSRGCINFQLTSYRPGKRSQV